MHYFVKRLVTCALDKNNREREMASVLLSSLYANVRRVKGWGAGSQEYCSMDEACYMISLV